jgi:Holliday junction resolvase
MNSKQKGKRGELEFSHFLKERGIEARRGQQFSGGDDSPDVVHNIPGIHFEVKRCEAGNPYKWLEQAINDAGNKTPIVAHRKNKKEWVAIMRMEDVINLLSPYVDAPELTDEQLATAELRLPEG